MGTRTVLRQSQLITTFGPGAMVDLPTRSVLISGLDQWRMKTKDRLSFKKIDEPLLARRLEKWLRDNGRLEADKTLELLTPPVSQEFEEREPDFVAATIFPKWFVCERVETVKVRDGERPGRRLVHWDDLRPEGGRRQYVFEDKKKVDVTPLRFVGACEDGHLQDIEWRRLVHGGERCADPLWLTEEGASASLADLEVVCGCGRSVAVQDLTKPGRLGRCDGRQPWLSAAAAEPCENRLRLLTRSATNAYFSQTVTVISLPAADDELIRVIQEHLPDLDEVDSVNGIREACRYNRGFKRSVERYPEEVVFERLRAIRAQGAAEASFSPKLMEFDVLACGQAEIGVNGPDARLYARTLPRDAWARDAGVDLRAIQAVVAVHRLREIMCLYGFTRLEPAATDSDGDVEDIHLAVTGAPIASRTDWLPAVEQFGEGLFIQFDPDWIDRWLARPAVRDRTDVLIAGFDAHRNKYPRSAGQHFPGAAYVALHSLSHALMTEISLECGYPASSLKERIYAFGAQDRAARRFGLLIYTASTGAQGTLGGLVGTAPRLSGMLARCLERLDLCSNDPVCADHVPGDALDERALLGAACHGCLLVAETSCERRNQLLDRALLVDTIAVTGCALFL